MEDCRTYSSLILQSTPHMRGATVFKIPELYGCIILQSTPHMRGATFAPDAFQTIIVDTSIHAPHAWGDQYVVEVFVFNCVLQSTPHMRGATVYGWPKYHQIGDFNPRPTCVGRLHSYLNIIYATDFNPRPTCVGRLNVFKAVFNLLKLQSTPHMRGATGMRSCKSQTAQTSIHAPHAWGDQTAQHRK